MADLVRMSACPKKSESLDLCSDKFFIHLMDHKSVETQITKVVKQRQHTHTLFQQYRLVACGGTERVVTGLKPFFSSFRNYRTAAALAAAALAAAAIAAAARAAAARTAARAAAARAAVVLGIPSVGEPQKLPIVENCSTAAE